MKFSINVTMNLLCVIVIMFYNVLLTSTERFPIKLTVTENQDGAGKEIIHLRDYIKKKNLPINLNITGNNGRRFRFIKSSGNATINFLLDSKSGSLQLRSSLNREEFCYSTKLHCIIKLLITYGNNNNIIDLSIEILDRNDNRPVFPTHPKTISIQENSDIGLEKALPIAEDRDSQPNSIKTYKMSNLMTNSISNHYSKPATYYFDVVTKMIGQFIRPYLKIKQKIDREETKDFKFLLIAEDTGALSGTTTISIIITDSNDNSPEWTSKNIAKTIKECSSYGHLFELQAIDKDDPSTPNGQITYRISDHSPNLDFLKNLFYIDGSKFYLSTQPINANNIAQNGKLSFFITARDGGGRENDISVVITIEDCNDHAPRIELEVSINSIRENDKNSLHIAQITVRDNDKGINSDFDCKLNDSFYFQLNKIDDLSDLNSNGNGHKLVIYSIVKRKERSFDRETVNHYTVLIRCVDHGNPQLTGEKRLTVSIDDENDNPPKFSRKEFEFTVVENNYISTNVGRVRAYDPDLGDNGRVIYRILEQKYLKTRQDSPLNFHLDSTSPFTINKQGAIETTTQFDREQIFEYRIRILATDSSGSGVLNDTCVAVIRVLDVNDCVPVFKNQYFYRVTESDGQANIHSVLGDVRAYDYDKGENGTLAYQLRLSKSVDYNTSKTALGLLQLTRKGKLSIHGHVDRESFESLQAELVAIDNGKLIQQTGTTTIIIDILDLNDNKPLFRLPPRNKNRYPNLNANHGQMEISINVSLDTPVGTDIYTFKAEDPDKGENGTISYSIIGYLDWFPFSLQTNGILILEKSLLNNNNNSPDDKASGNNAKKSSGNSMPNIIKRYPETLLIKASDGGVNPRSGMMTLKIKYIQSKNSNNFDYKNPNWNSGNQPLSGGNSKYQGNNNKYHSNNNNYHGNTNIDGPVEDSTPDSLILLFILAAVLFVVFLVVLLILLYTYFTGRLTRSHRTNNQSGLPHDKNINNYKKEFNNYECELLNPENPNFQTTLGKMAAMQNGTSIKSDKTNYTHLIAMRDSKYTPIHFQSNFNPNQSQFLQNYSIATSSNPSGVCLSPNTLNNNTSNNNYGNTILNNNISNIPHSTPQRSTIIPHSPPLNRCVTVSPTTAIMQPRWNSIENLTSKNPVTLHSNNTLTRPSATTNKQSPYQHNNKPTPLNSGILYNSHSYAAYINQFGKSPQDDDRSLDNQNNDDIAITMAVMTDKKDKKGHTLPPGMNANDLVHYEALQGHNDSNNSPQTSANKKSYVTSSFV